MDLIVEDIVLPELEGSIRVGPITLPRRWRSAELIAAMTKHNLSIARADGVAIQFKPSVGAMTIIAEGPGVLGYFIGPDDIEIACTNLELFGAEILGGLPFVVEGEHNLGNGMKLVCRTEVVADPSAFTGVAVKKTRELIKI